VQTVVLNISANQAAYAAQVAAELKRAGVRAEADLRNEKITYKIREHSLQKLPYQVIVGDKEIENQSISVRARAGKDLGSQKIEDFTSNIKVEIGEKKLPQE